MDFTIRDPRVKFITDGRIKIRPKDGGKAVVMRPSNVQRKVLRTIEDDVKLGRPIRHIDLKPRQVMMSSIIAAFFYAWARTEQGVSILVAAQKEGTVEDLWRQKYKTFLTHDLDDEGKQPETKYNSKTSLEFAGEENSGSVIDIRIGSPDLGRGGTRQGVHLTEYPYMKNPEQIWAELIPCVPKTPNTAVFVESTGAKPGDDYEKMFRASWEAQKRGELLEYRALFFPWTDQEDYFIELTAAEEAALKAKLEPDEFEMLRNAPGMTLGHLAWRRAMIRETFRGDVSSFVNKYPLTPDEAFSARRESCFDHEAMFFYRKWMIRDPDFRARVVLDAKRNPRFDDSPAGELWVWGRAIRPAQYEKFTVYLDPAGFYGSETEDYHSESAAAVVNNDTGEVVATWAGRSEPADFAKIGYAIGSWWNTATLVVETNNHGHLTFHELLQLGYRNLWFNDTVDSRVIEKQRGLTMNVNTRREIVDKMQDLIKHRRLGLHCSRTFAQMETFVKPLAGAQRAKKGSQDDLVIAVAGASWVASRYAEWGSHEAQELRQSMNSPSGPTRGRLWIPGMRDDMAYFMGTGQRPTTANDPDLFDMIMSRR